MFTVPAFVWPSRELSYPVLTARSRVRPSGPAGIIILDRYGESIREAAGATSEITA